MKNIENEINRRNFSLVTNNPMQQQQLRKYAHFHSNTRAYKRMSEMNENGFQYDHESRTLDNFGAQYRRQYISFHLFIGLSRCV